MNSVNRSVFPSLNRICDYVEYYAHVDPQREALVLGDVRYDYRKFNELTDRAGSALANLGLKAGDRVAGMITPRPEFAILLMAALRNGLIWVGINPRYTSREIQYILDDAKPSLLFSITSDLSGRDFEDDLRSCRDDSPFLRKIITIPESIPDLTERWGDFLSSVSADASTARRVQPEANSEHSAEPAVIVYTSGTTGNPKGALLSHDNLIYSFDSVSRSFAGKDELRVGMRTLCNLPTNHIGCISELVGNTLICGGTLVFAERFNAAEVLRIIEAERINQFGGVPLMLEQIFSQLDLTQTDMTSVRIIGWGGAPASQDLVEKMSQLKVHLFTNYGLTEGGAIFTATPPDASLEILTNTVGLPDPNQEHRIIREDGSNALPGETGELLLRGRGVFMGYWNNTVATTLAIDKEGWLHTGDLLSIRSDGYWELKGRKTEMFKSGGYNVYPREIELCLEQHKQISQAVVVSVPDKKYFEVGHAFITLVEPETLLAKELEDYLRSRLAAYKVPKKIQVVSELPMLPIGKVDKKVLKSRVVPDHSSA